MTSAAATAATAPAGLPRDGLVWGLAYAVVIAAHLAGGLALLRPAPETGPVEAAEPIAMIDLPPAPVLPEAVTALDLPVADALSVPVADERPVGGSTVPDIAPEAPEPIAAPLAEVERLPAETAPPPPVSTVRPTDVVAFETAPPDTAVPLAADEAPPVDAPVEATEIALPDALRSEPPLEAAPVIPDAAVTLAGPVALPRVKPDAPPPPSARATPPAAETSGRQATKPQASKRDATKPHSRTPAARPAARKTTETPAAKRPAGPAADTPKAGARPQSAAAAPHSGGGGPVADALKQYQARVRADIEREIGRMPRERKGSAQVRLSLTRGGALSGARIARSSGDPSVDRTIVHAVKRACPFPAAPASLTEASFTWVIRITID